MESLILFLLDTAAIKNIHANKSVSMKILKTIGFYSAYFCVLIVLFTLVY